jgi:hypothetical protein
MKRIVIDEVVGLADVSHPCVAVGRRVHGPPASGPQLFGAGEHRRPAGCRMWDDVGDGDAVPSHDKAFTGFDTIEDVRVVVPQFALRD